LPWGREMLCASIPSPVLLQPQEDAQGSAGSMGQAEGEMHPWYPKPNEMAPGVSPWAGGVVSRGQVPRQGTGLQAWAAVSVAHGCSGCSGYNTGLVSGRRRVAAAPPGHPMCWGSFQNASSSAESRGHPRVGGLRPSGNPLSHEALSLTGRRPRACQHLPHLCLGLRTKPLHLLSQFSWDGQKLRLKPLQTDYTVTPGVGVPISWPLLEAPGGSRAALDLLRSSALNK